MPSADCRKAARVSARAHASLTRTSTWSHTDQPLTGKPAPVSNTHIHTVAHTHRPLFNSASSHKQAVFDSDFARTSVHMYALRQRLYLDLSCVGSCIHQISIHCYFAVINIHSRVGHREYLQNDFTGTVCMFTHCQDRVSYHSW